MRCCFMNLNTSSVVAFGKRSMNCRHSDSKVFVQDWCVPGGFPSTHRPKRGSFTSRPRWANQSRNVHGKSWCAFGLTMSAGCESIACRRPRRLVGGEIAGNLLGAMPVAPPAATSSAPLAAVVLAFFAPAAASSRTPGFAFGLAPRRIDRLGFLVPGDMRVQGWV